MKCTECSQDIKPIVALDIDGTLTDYHNTFAGFAANYFDIPMVTSWNGYGEMEDWMGLTKAEYREAKLAYRQGGMKRLQPILPGAKELTYALRRAGAEVWLTTTRPWNRFDSTDPDTRHWLDKHEIHWDHLLYNDVKYSQLGILVDPERVVGVLEDLPDQYAMAAVVFGGRVPLLIKRQHNEWQRETENYRTAQDLTEAASMLTASVGIWKRENNK